MQIYYPPPPEKKKKNKRQLAQKKRRRYTPKAATALGRQTMATNGQNSNPCLQQPKKYMRCRSRSSSST